MLSTRTRLFAGTLYRNMSTSRPHSPPTPPGNDSPPSKRVKLQHPVASTSRLPYGTGLHLAPMVRIGTLPSRLLALEYGAELVWGPEIVDKAIIGATREVDPKTGTIRFMRNGRSIWETHPIEKSRLIFQLGSADPELAVQAVKIIEHDVAGVGLNCGCPKPFSISGGMGAALLETPDKLCSILRALVGALSLPVDVKIRLLPESAPTVSLVSRLLETGVSALTVHCRTRDMRSTEAAMHHRLEELVGLGKQESIPVIANGDCMQFDDREKIMRETGVDSIMIARGAEANFSCFRPQGLLDPIKQVMPAFLKVAIAVNNPFHNTKYILGAMNLAVSPEPPKKIQRSEMKQAISKSKTHEQMAEILKISAEEVDQLQQGNVADLLPNWTQRMKLIEKENFDSITIVNRAAEEKPVQAEEEPKQIIS